jgi:predicted acylesterase/phospholipase RssA
MTPAPDDIALVLPGGGAWIYAQAAALDVLLRQPGIQGRIKGIYGNSAGSISTACLAHGLYNGVGTDTLMKALGKVHQDTDIYTPGFSAVAKHPWAHPIDISRICNGAVFGVSAFDQQPLWDLLQATLGSLTTKDVLAKTGVEVLARAFESGGRGGLVLDGILWEMAAASSAIECAFKPFRGLSDGGPFDNCPVDLALARGFRRILIVYCGPDGPLPDLSPVTLDATFGKGPDLLARQVAMNTLGKITQMNESLNDARLVPWVAGGGQLVECYPAEDVEMGSILDFSDAAQVPRVQAGHAAAALALGQARTFGWT